MGIMPKDTTASAETYVHKAVYQTTSKKAIIRTHSTYAVALPIQEVDPYSLSREKGPAFWGICP